MLNMPAICRDVCGGREVRRGGGRQELIANGDQKHPAKLQHSVSVAKSLSE